MNRREEIIAHELATNFMRQVVPEYIAEYGRAIDAEGNLSKFTLRFENDIWTVESSVQGEDFQAYHPILKVNLAEQKVDSVCNCMESFNGPCRHAAATAIHFINSLDISNDSAPEPPAPREDWRHSFRLFFSGVLEPEIGRHYFLFRFFPEPGRLSVEFFRARQNKTGISSVRQEITLDQILRNPEWCEHSPDLPIVCRQIAQYLDYYGHRVEIPDGLLS